MEPIIRINDACEKQDKNNPPFGDIPSAQEINTAHQDNYLIRVKKIWQSVLGIAVSTNSNFFEIGGHSLAAVKVIQKIYDDLRIDLNVSDLYDRPHLSGFANYVKEMSVIKPVNEPLPALEKIFGYESFPVTSAQRRLWYVDKYENTAVAYNVPLVFDIEGDLHLSRLKKAFTTLVKRHDIFQTSFVMDEKNIPRQVKIPTISFELKTEETKGDITSRICEIIQVPFNLDVAPLFRAILLKISDQSNRYILVMVMHHILCDEITINFLLAEISKLYRENSDENKPNLTMTDYAVWENEFVQTRLNDCEKYWRMASARWQLENPLWKIRLQENRVVSGKNAIIKIDYSLFSKIKSFAILQEISLHSVFVSMLSAFIYRYFNKEKVAFLIPVSCREHKEAAHMPGFFLNLLPLVQEINDSTSFAEHAKQTNKQISEILSYRFFPFEKLKSKLSHNDGLQIDAIVSFQDKEAQQLSLEGLNISQRHVHTGYVKFPLNFNFIIYHSYGEIEIEYSNSIDLFDFTEVNKSFLNFIQCLIDHYHEPLHHVSPLSLEEKQIIIDSGKGVTTPLKHNNIAECLYSAFHQYSSRIGLVIKNKHYSYDEIYRISRKFSVWIQNQSVDRHIVIIMDGTEKSIFCCLGVWLAGHVYIPVTSDLPAHRLEMIINDSNPALVCYSEQISKPAISVPNLIWIDFDSILSSMEDGQAILSGLQSQPDDDLYIIYTSGTTGVPKGVKQTHRTIINLVDHMERMFDGTVKNIAQLASFNFDVSIQELLFTLITGRCLFVASHIKKDIKLVNKFVSDNKIHLIIFTPTYFYEWANISNKLDIQYQDLKIIITSGEKLTLNNSVTKFLTRHPLIQLHDQYGPTETHVVIDHLVTRENVDNGVIGKAIANTQILVTNHLMEVLPYGVLGEICIAGAGVASGYVSSIENKFVPHPLNAYSMIYKTGDFGRMLANGNVIFHGRRDRQVKVRGYRVELAEIESVLCQHENIAQATVLHLKRNENDILVAFYVINDCDIRIKELRGFLLTHLPEYMVPGFYLAVESIPITLNGKVDYDQLESLFKTENSIEDEESDYYHVIIKNVWRKSINVAPTLECNFYEIGGHSLAAISVVSEIGKIFGIEIPISALFKLPRFSDFVDYVKKIHTGHEIELSKIIRTDRDRALPVSGIQKRICLAENNRKYAGAYNLPIVFDVHGSIDIEYLQNTLLRIVHEHEILRTIFKYNNGNLNQFIHENIDSYKILFRSVDDNDFDLAIDELIHQPFDLSQWPLFRIVYLTSKTKSILVLVFHHIIVDGRTIELFLAEMQQKLNHNHELKSSHKYIEYADYVIHRMNLCDKEHYLDKKRYWVNKVNDFIPVNINENLLSLNSANEHYGLYVYSVSMDTGKMNELLLRHHLHPFTILLSAFSIIAWRITGKEYYDLVSVIDESLFITEGNIWGPLLNFIVLRIELNRNENVINLIQRINTELLSSLKHADYPIVDAMASYDIKPRSDIFENCLIYHYYHTHKKMVFNDATLNRKNIYCRKLKNSFSINFYPEQNDIKLVVEYDTRKYDELFIGSFIKSFDKVINDILSNYDAAITSLNLLDEEPSHRLLVQYNQTITDYPINKKLFDLFSLHSKSNRIALKYSETMITYYQLDRQISDLAKSLLCVLKTRNIKLSPIVAIFLDRKPHTITLIISLAKLGICYFPVDIRTPDLKIKKMLTEVNPCFILTDQSQHDRLYDLNLAMPILNIDKIAYGHSEIDVAEQEHDERIALLSTSGTTDSPKHVQIINKSVVRLIKNTNYLTIDDNDTIAHFASYSFDVSLLEIWGALANGASLLLIPEEYLFDSVKLEDYLHSNGVTIIFIPSKIFNQYASERPSLFSKLKHLYVGGDKLNTSSVNRLKKLYPCVRISNLYGSTENTTNTTYYDIPCEPMSGETVPIGKPVSNTQVYILDSALFPLPVGIPIELTPKYFIRS